MKKSVIIIGSGMAAYMFAMELRSINSDILITILTETDGRYYPKPVLSSANYHKKSIDMIVTSDAAQMSEKYNIDIKCFDKVVDIDKEKRIVFTEKGFEFLYDSLVLACGSEPKRLPFQGGVSDNVFQVNNIEDYASFLEGLEGKEEVLVIGSGLVGVEFAHDLVCQGKKVTVLSQSEFALSEIAPDRIGRQVRDNLCNMGVVWKVSKGVESIEKDDSGLYVKCLDGLGVNCEIALAAIGLKSRVDLAAKLGVEENMVVKADRFAETSLKNIYAIGDCVSIEGLCLTYVAPIKHQVKALALTISGKKTAICYPAMPVVVKMPTCPLTLIPLRGTPIEGGWYTETDNNDAIVCVYRDLQSKVRAVALMGDGIKERNKWLSQIDPLL